MSLEQAIIHGKEHRKPYYDSRRFDWTCRNHGGCPWCEDNRLARERDRVRMANEAIYEAITEARP